MMQLLWKTICWFFKMLNRTTSDYTPRWIPKGIENRDRNTYLYVNFHSNITHNGPKLETPQCSSMDEWINKTCHICKMEYYSAIIKNEEREESKWLPSCPSTICWRTILSPVERMILAPLSKIN